MSHLLRAFALLLVFVSIPGGTEIVENVVHLAASGHTAHATDDLEHARHGDEHGCTGTSHVCPCHTSTPFLVVIPRRIRLEPPSASSVAFSAHARSLVTQGFSLGVYRPPSVARA